MSCGTSMVKYILFLFNLLCSICGILLIIFGGLLFSNIHSVEDFSEAVRTQQIPITMIVLGSVILLVSFFGCCGAIRESYCMSMTYSIMLFVLMIGQLACVVYIWTQKEQYLHKMGEVVDRAWEHRTSRSNYMDAIQLSMKCCGRISSLDYSHGNLPATCCPGPNYCTLGQAYRSGCRHAFVEFWDRNSDIIKYSGLVIAAIEFVGFIFACCLANSIRNHRRRAEY